MSLKSKLIKILLPILIILGGIAVAGFMIANRPEPQKVVKKNPGALVETLTVERGERRVQVHGTGTVQPRREVELAPQVGGRVVETAPDLVEGGFFREGDLLFRIEDADYRLAVERASAALAKAEYDLATVQGQARVARAEWDRLQLGDGEKPNPLVLYEPQLKNARAALLSARAALEQARLDLERTTVRAPFDGILRSESVDVGQYLRAGNPVAVLAGTDRAEIVVPLPLEEMGWVDIPRPGGRGEGSPAMVKLTTGGRTHEWPGRIVRSLGDVDPEGRMARVVVAVVDPYGLRGDAGEGKPALALGTFVEVALLGETLEDVAVLPASVLRDGEQVWVMNDSHLKFRPVHVVRLARDELIVGEGLRTGERVVLTNVAGAAEGMKLRPAEESGRSASVPVQEKAE